MKSNKKPVVTILIFMSLNEVATTNGMYVRNKRYFKSLGLLSAGYTFYRRVGEVAACP